MSFAFAIAIAVITAVAVAAVAVAVAVAMVVVDAKIAIVKVDDTAVEEEAKIVVILLHFVEFVIKLVIASFGGYEAVGKEVVPVESQQEEAL